MELPVQHNGEKVPFWEPESSAASVSPSTQTTTCIRRPAVAACAVGIIPRREERALVVDCGARA